jgi:hypothetical protein
VAAPWHGGYAGQVHAPPGSADDPGRNRKIGPDRRHGRVERAVLEDRPPCQTWLAAVTLRCSAAAAMKAQGPRPLGFIAGVWMLWHNPKGWAITVSAAASFASLADKPVQLGLLLAATFGIFAIVSLSTWCVTGLMLSRLLRTDGQWRATFRWALACGIHRADLALVKEKRARHLPYTSLAGSIGPVANRRHREARTCTDR